MLRRQVAIGGVWVLLQSVILRAMTIGTQFILAWLLLPSSFGVMSIAFGLSVLVDVLNQIGITEILINRYRKFHLWGPPSHAIVMVIGLLTGLVLLVIGEVSSRVYQEEDLRGILAIFAFSALIQSFGVVSQAKLKAEMKFREIAIIQVVATIASIATSIGLALLGFGAFSIAWARPAEVLTRTIGVVCIARVGFLWRITFRGWKYLLSDCFHSYLTTLFNIAIHQCDYLILGFFVSKTVGGLYFMAFTLSSQALSLIVLNLVGVLYTALAKLSQDRKQLTRAVLASSKVLALISVPICALQFVNAPPLIPLVLDRNWLGVIPLVQIISVGAAFRCVGWQWRSQLKAQKKFVALAYISGISCAICLSAVTIGVALGGVIGCAISVSIYYILASPLQLYYTVRNTGGTLLQVLDLFLRPVLLVTISFLLINPG